jgi:hypothetical protein
MSAGPVVADTFAGRIHVEWDNSATVTPLGQLPFFIEFVKQGSLFASWVADCPLHYRKRLVDLGKAEPQLTATVTFAQRQLALDASSQDHDAAIPAPALKAQAAILALPARTGILPILLAHRPLDRALDPLGQAQLAA